VCGIYGLVQRRERVDPASVSARCARLKHRGPDDVGVWLSKDGRVCLAHRRLSIIDLSPTGHQPMMTSDGRFVVIFNGEIYNFRTLRADLEAAGYGFEGTSDTEVLLAAYRAWGESCVDRLNGMFAFAIYDRGDDGRGPSVFFARDRVGEKPLYYALDERRLQLASELKAIDGGRDVDLVALEHYLALGYVPGALCLASGVAKLPPAHAARLDIDRWDLRIWRYWELPVNAPEAKIDGESLADEAERLLRDSVAMRLVADVPVGVLLSGGLDSSLVTAAAAAVSSQPLKTFTISVPGTRYDELPFAAGVAAHFGTDHHVLSLDQPSLDTIQELAPFVDEPIADSSIIPTFLVSKLTRSNVKVGLAGDGGDEIFGGYSHYAKTLSDLQRWGWVPNAVWRPVANLAARLPAGVRGRRRISSLRNGPLEQNLWGTNFFDPALRRRLVRPERQTAGLSLGCPERALPEATIRDSFLTGRGPLDRMMRADFYGQLGGGYLVKIDRASMAHGLELRVPLLDNRLVEFCFGRVPDLWKVGNGATRRIERILAKRMLPPDFIVNRKQGFSVPLEDWFRRSNCNIVREHIHYLPAPIVRAEVKKLIDGHMRGRSNGARLFSLLMLAIAAKNNAWT
jgi:asparagine synthase (glutamine-hydrolysing)